MKVSTGIWVPESTCFKSAGSLFSWPKVKRRSIYWDCRSCFSLERVTAAKQFTSDLQARSGQKKHSFHCCSVWNKCWSWAVNPGFTLQSQGVHMMIWNTSRRLWPWVAIAWFTHKKREKNDTRKLNNSNKPKSLVIRKAWLCCFSSEIHGKRNNQSLSYLGQKNQTSAHNWQKKSEE